MPIKGLHCISRCNNPFFSALMDITATQDAIVSNQGSNLEGNGFTYPISFTADACELKTNLRVVVSMEVQKCKRLNNYSADKNKE